MAGATAAAPPRSDASDGTSLDRARWPACEEYRWVENSGAQAAPAHLLLNLAAGGSWAGRYGIDDSKMPTQLDVDYVRVYRKG